jgi:hypothetical protein
LTVPAIDALAMIEIAQQSFCKPRPISPLHQPLTDPPNPLYP